MIFNILIFFLQFITQYYNYYFFFLITDIFLKKSISSKQQLGGEEFLFKIFDKTLFFDIIEQNEGKTGIFIS